MPGPDPSPGESDRQRVDAEFQRVYEQLRAVARQMLVGEPGQTLQATALVHEAYFRLVRGGEPAPADPGHFHRLAATAMRTILIDHARSRGRQKRGGGRERLTLDAVELASGGDTDTILEVDEALERLQAKEPALAELVRLRFFTGLSMAEAAKALGLSERSAYRDWDYAKALLLRELRAGP